MSSRPKHKPVSWEQGLGYTISEWEEGAHEVTEHFRWSLRHAGAAVAGTITEELDLELVVASAERALERIGAIRHAARVLLSADHD